MRNKSCVLLFVSLLGCGALSGCGSESNVVPLRGEVTYAGKPIPLGKIVFTPDTNQGNSGAQGFATIEAGKFNTAGRAGRGSMPGPVFVKIEGYAVSPANSDAWLGKPLFSKPYEQTLVISTEQAELTIEIPATHK